MQKQHLIELAAQNNAEWCDIVCSAHDAPGSFTQAMWVNNHSVPVYYPNIVTLQRGVDALAIQQLVATRNGGWSVKDSFDELDLSASGFHRLFDAQWLLAPESASSVANSNNTKWTTINDAYELASWESAWGGSEAQSLFKPSLLEDPRLRFIAAYEHGKIVAGAIVNTSQAVVGISNVFYPKESGTEYWHGILRLTRKAFPGQPIVGYEHGDELALAIDAGLRPIGPLSVWVK